MPPRLPKPAAEELVGAAALPLTVDTEEVVTPSNPPRPPVAADELVLMTALVARLDEPRTPPSPLKPPLAATELELAETLSVAALLEDILEAD